MRAPPAVPALKKSDFHFELPPELIAQEPLAERSASRLLLVPPAPAPFEDRAIRVDLPALLRAGDLLVFNDTRVVPARLYGAKETGGRVEILLERITGEAEVRAQIGASKSPKPNSRIVLDDGTELTVLGRDDEFYRLRFETSEPLQDVLQRAGHMPLPPYIHRSDTEEDRDRYQTVFNNEPGSAAAPTAGLHFTPEVLDQLRQRGVQIETITLHVGLGTFQPVRAENVEDIHLHAEHYTLPAATADAINAALREKRRIIAAGTTTTRTLEHCAHHATAGDRDVAAFEPHAGVRLHPHSGETSIFISPGYPFRVVSGLLTNFHLPQSTLLMLVSAFAGTEAVLAAYNHAVRERYRFFSYGDCMLIL